MNPKFKDILHYWTPDKYSAYVWYIQLKDLEVQLQENLCKKKQYWDLQWSWWGHSEDGAASA